MAEAYSGRATAHVLLEVEAPWTSTTGTMHAFDIYCQGKLVNDLLPACVFDALKEEVAQWVKAVESLEFPLGAGGSKGAGPCPG